jgi:hypothetical protein
MYLQHWISPSFETPQMVLVGSICKALKNGVWKIVKPRHLFCARNRFVLLVHSGTFLTPVLLVFWNRLFVHYTALASINLFQDRVSVFHAFLEPFKINKERPPVKLVPRASLVHWVQSLPTLSRRHDCRRKFQELYLLSG